MKRGESSIAFVVLMVIGIVGAIATVILVGQPTGLIPQGQSMYPLEDVSGLGIECQGVAAFLGYNADFRVYCCLEHMIGQNECRVPHRVRIA